MRQSIKNNQLSKMPKSSAAQLSTDIWQTRYFRHAVIPAILLKGADGITALSGD
jgi:hypothetical protein